MAKDTRDRILMAALEQFSQNGYAGTNIRELTASLGLAKSSMYKHFLTGTKEMFTCIFEGMMNKGLLKKTIRKCSHLSTPRRSPRSFTCAAANRRKPTTQ